MRSRNLGTHSFAAVAVDRLFPPTKTETSTHSHTHTHTHTHTHIHTQIHTHTHTNTHTQTVSECKSKNAKTTCISTAAAAAAGISEPHTLRNPIFQEFYVHTIWARYLVLKCLKYRIFYAGKQATAARVLAALLVLFAMAAEVFV